MKRKGESKRKQKHGRDAACSVRERKTSGRCTQRPYIDELEQFKDDKVGLNVKTAEQDNTKTKH